MLGAFGAWPWIMVSPVLATGASLLSRVLPWVVGLILFAIAAGVGITLLRRKVLAGPAETETPPMILSELRALRESGELSEQEFEQAKQALIAGIRGERASDANVRITKPAAAPRRSDARNAPPGVDLTGEPLPEPPGDSFHS